MSTKIQTSLRQDAEKLSEAKQVLPFEVALPL